MENILVTIDDIKKSLDSLNEKGIKAVSSCVIAIDYPVGKATYGILLSVPSKNKLFLEFLQSGVVHPYQGKKETERNSR